MTTPNAWTPAQVLATPMEPDDSGADTIRGYLVALLAELWRERAGFSGKRPFGESGWEYDLYYPLVKAGLVAGSFDEDGALDAVDREAADRLIAEAIQALGEGAPLLVGQRVRVPDGRVGTVTVVHPRQVAVTLDGYAPINMPFDEHALRPITPESVDS